MANRSTIAGTLFFCIFFAAGLGSISLSILCDEINCYYETQRALEQIKVDNLAMKDKIADYDDQIALIINNPKVLERIKGITLGKEFVQEDTAFPLADSGTLNKAKSAVSGVSKEEKIATMAPPWLEKIRQFRSRTTLFISGAALILICFAFFGPILDRWRA